MKGRQAAEEHRRATEEQNARDIAARLEQIELIIKSTGGADGRLYGSVTSKEIAEQLSAQHGIEVDKRKITLAEPIKAFGAYQAGVRLYADVTGTIRVTVTEK